MTDPIPASEIEQIRGRHINKHDDPDFSESDGYDAHNDRWTLLRALDAATEENAGLRSAHIQVAMLLHFALVHDEAREGPLGSLTGTHASNAWCELPEGIRSMFPSIRETAAKVKAGERVASVPFDPRRAALKEPGQ
jgi:hypothetical protein